MFAILDYSLTWSDAVTLWEVGGWKRDAGWGWLLIGYPVEMPPV